MLGNLMYHYLYTVAVAIRDLSREYLISGLKGIWGSLCLTPAVLNAPGPSMPSLINNHRRCRDPSMLGSRQVHFARASYQIKITASRLLQTISSPDAY